VDRECSGTCASDASHVLIDRRRLLSAAAAATGVLAVRSRVSAQSSAQIPGPPGEPTPGRARWLGLGDGGRDGLLYVPNRFTPDQAMPLAVVLHGAGGTSMSTQYAFPFADTFGFIVLAPDSRDQVTWDLLLGEWGPDPEFIGEAMRYTMRQCAVRRDRIGLAGFSDGASYALSLGIGGGDVFSRIMAMSPGVMQPAAVRGKPTIFISHGTSDQVMPIDITSRKFVPRLRGLGYDVTYREYDGRHQLPPAIARDAFEWFSK
jgi:phospholipase/carboxylesterase